MEEDIERCEQLTKEEHANWIGISNQKAIENLIKGYRELEKRTISLTNLLCINDSDNNYIPKSKIQAKIDELGEWEYNDDFEPNLAVMSDIQLLSELLEDK